MSEGKSPYTAEYTTKELEMEVANLRSQLADARLECIEYRKSLRRISTNLWYRVGRIMRVCP